MDLSCENNLQLQHIDYFYKKAHTTDVRPDSECASKLRFDQTMRNLICRDLENRLVVIQLEVAVLKRPG